METNLILNGHSPAMPLDLILQSLAQASFSGFLRAVSRSGEQFRLIFKAGRLALAQGACSFDAVVVVRALLAVESVWVVEPFDTNTIHRGTLDLSAVLLDVARVNDEAQLQTSA